MLASLARARMRSKHDRLVQALTGRFDDDHAELARMLLDQIDALSAQISTLTTRIGKLIAAIPPPRASTSMAAPARTPGADRAPQCCPRSTVSTRSPASAAKPPRHHRRDRPAHERLPHRRRPGVLGEAVPPRQSGAKDRSGKTGKGNPYLKAVLGEAAATAGKTDTFLGERYRRLARRRGKLKALVAIARSILVIVWPLLTDRGVRYRDAGASYHASRIGQNRKIRNHFHQLEALGYTAPPSRQPDRQLTPTGSAHAPPGATARHLGVVIFRLVLVSPDPARPV